MGFIAHGKPLVHWLTPTFPGQLPGTGQALPGTSACISGSPRPPVPLPASDRPRPLPTLPKQHRKLGDCGMATGQKDCSQCRCNSVGHQGHCGKRGGVYRARDGVGVGWGGRGPHLLAHGWAPHCRFQEGSEDLMAEQTLARLDAEMDKEPQSQPAPGGGRAPACRRVPRASLIKGTAPRGSPRLAQLQASAPALSL